MNIEKKYIYDLVTRLSHAGIGLSIFGLIATSQLAKIYYEDGHLRHLFWYAHIALGFILIFFFSWRVAWMIFGPKHSKFKSFIFINQWKKIRSLHHIKKMEWDWGHHPIASIAYLVVYLLILISIITGLFLARIQFDIGPINQKFYDDLNYLIELMNIHNFVSTSMIIFIFAHLYALTLHRIKDNVPTFTSMLDGYQHKKKNKDE